MEVGSSSLPGTTLRPQGQCGLGNVCLGLHIGRKVNVIQVKNLHNYSLRGGLAQLARALAWHARGRGFEPHLLHKKKRLVIYYKAFFNYVTGSIPTEYPLKTI